MLEGFEHDFVEVFPRWKDLSTLARVSQRWKSIAEYELDRRMQKAGVRTLDNTNMPWERERSIRIAVWTRYHQGKIPLFEHPLRSTYAKSLHHYMMETGITNLDREVFEKKEKRQSMIEKMGPLLFDEQ